MLKRACLLIPAFLAALAFAAPAAAERFTLHYRGAVFGLVPLGEVMLDIDATADSYRVSTRLNSSALMSLFERTRLNAEASGRIQAGAVRWERYVLDHHYSRKHRAISMQPAAGGVSATIAPNYVVWGEPPASDAQRAVSRDPLSSLVAMAVQVGQTRRCEGAYLTFDGRFHYRLELSGGESERFNEGGYRGPALRCRLRYVPISGFEPHDGGRRNRIPTGDIWFALPGDAAIAPPVRVVAPLPFGRAGITLTRWQRPSVEIAEMRAD